MITPAQQARAEFFDSIADEWDSWQDAKTLSAQLDGGLRRMGVSPDEFVADIGCGTGNLTAALLLILSPRGRILASDISPRMLEVARTKIHDTRVTWLLAPAEMCTGYDGQLHRVICYSVWPHLDDPLIAARQFFRMLKPGGFVHVWHLVPRERVNEIHRDAHPAVRGDMLHPATEVAGILVRAGFEILESQDGESCYLVSGRKPSQEHGR